MWSPAWSTRGRYYGADQPATAGNAPPAWPLSCSVIDQRATTLVAPSPVRDEDPLVGAVPRREHPAPVRRPGDSADTAGAAEQLLRWRLAAAVGSPDHAPVRDRIEGDVGERARGRRPGRVHELPTGDVRRVEADLVVDVERARAAGEEQRSVRREGELLRRALPAAADVAGVRVDDPNMTARSRVDEHVLGAGLPGRRHGGGVRDEDVVALPAAADDVQRAAGQIRHSRVCGGPAPAGAGDAGLRDRQPASAGLERVEPVRLRGDDELAEPPRGLPVGAEQALGAVRVDDPWAAHRDGQDAALGGQGEERRLRVLDADDLLAADGVTHAAEHGAAGRRDAAAITTRRPLRRRPASAANRLRDRLLVSKTSRTTVQPRRRASSSPGTSDRDE